MFSAVGFSSTSLRCGGRRGRARAPARARLTSPKSAIIPVRGSTSPSTRDEEPVVVAVDPEARPLVAGEPVRRREVELDVEPHAPPVGVVDGRHARSYSSTNDLAALACTRRRTATLPGERPGAAPVAASPNVPWPVQRRRNTTPSRTSRTRRALRTVVRSTTGCNAARRGRVSPCAGTPWQSSRPLRPCDRPCPAASGRLGDLTCRPRPRNRPQHVALASDARSRARPAVTAVRGSARSRRSRSQPPAR